MVAWSQSSEQECVKRLISRMQNAYGIRNDLPLTGGAEGEEIV